MLFINDIPSVGDYVIHESTYLFISSPSYEITREGFIDITKDIGNKIEKWYHDFIAWLRRKATEFGNWLRRKRKGSIPGSETEPISDTKINFEINKKFKGVIDDIKNKKKGVTAKLEAYKADALEVIETHPYVDIADYRDSLYSATIPIELEVSNLFEIANTYNTFIILQQRYTNELMDMLDTGRTKKMADQIILEGIITKVDMLISIIPQLDGPGIANVSIIEFLNLYNDRDFGMSIKQTIDGEAKFLVDLLKAAEGLTEHLKNKLLESARAAMQRITSINQRLITSITVDMSREYIKLTDICMKYTRTLELTTRHNTEILEAKGVIGECDRLLAMIDYE